MSRAGRVILPGSYDPVTLGHLAVIREAQKRYKEVYAVIFVNPDKKYLFSIEERLRMLRLSTEQLEGVTVDISDGLVIDYMKKKGISEIFKGYRNDDDLEYERKMAEWNKENGGYDTVLWLCPDEISDISSTRVREALASGEIPKKLLPKAVSDYLFKRP